jgi:hypothetical protein
MMFRRKRSGRLDRSGKLDCDVSLQTLDRSLLLALLVSHPLTTPNMRRAVLKSGVDKEGWGAGIRNDTFPAFNISYGRHIILSLSSSRNTGPSVMRCMASRVVSWMYITFLVRHCDFFISTLHAHVPLFENAATLRPCVFALVQKQKAKTLIV